VITSTRYPQRPEDLTGRELQVHQMVADGLANTEIAWKLRISEQRVKAHVSAFLAKFGLQSRTQAAQYALRLGLVGSLPQTFAASLRVGSGRIVLMESTTRSHVPVAR
jgi:DNA-binding CsgD family transcriptional regulator